MTTHDIGRHLHCYGVGSVVSPNLDSLAAEGLRFDHAFATAPQCSSSRASLATGMYPHNNGVMGLAHAGFDWELAPSVPHSAALFAAFGFETHLFGGQHVTLHPERLGFRHMHPTGHERGNMTGKIIAAALEQLLYDLEADPLEEHNLAGSPSIKALEEDLSAALWRWMRETEDPLLEGPVASPRYRLAMQP